MRARSLFGRLVGGFMLVMGLIWVAALAHVAHQARVEQQRQAGIVNQGWTRQIMLNVRSVAHDPAEVRRIAVAIEALRQDMFRQLGFETFARTVVRQHGRELYNSRPGPLAGSGWVTWSESDAATGLQVERNERPDTDWLFSIAAAQYMLTPLVYSLPFLLLPAWLIVRRGLRPLRSMGEAIEQRGAADLAPLPASPYRELAPLVDAINRLMARLSRRIEREHEFLSDAAHEMKTPLSVIQINAHLLASPADEQQKQQAQRGVNEGVARASHTVHQLLAYERARAEPGGGAPPVEDLAMMVRDRLAQMAPLALQRRIDIEFEAQSLCQLPLHRESMVALLDNVICNAIKYSPDGGCIRVTLLADNENAMLRIVDQGPGIPAELREKVFERFYRVPGQDAAGSGLGLSIAERAAARNGAAIRLEDGPCRRGLAVVIEFHQARSAAV